MLYGNGVTPIDVLSARLRANNGLQGCYSSPQASLLVQAYQMQQQHQYSIRPSPQSVVPATSSPSYSPREYYSSPGDCPSEVPISRATSGASIQHPPSGKSDKQSLRRSLPVLQLDSLKEAQARQSDKVLIRSQGTEATATMLADAKCAAVDVRETVEFVDMAPRGLGSKRYPSAAMESQDEAPLPRREGGPKEGAASIHQAEDTVIMDEDTEGPVGDGGVGLSVLVRKEHSHNPLVSKWGNTSDLLSQNVSAVTLDDNSRMHTQHEDFHHRQDNDTSHYRSDRSFPLISAIDPTQLAHLQSRYTENSEGNTEDLSALDDFPLVSPTERGTPVVTGVLPHNQYDGGVGGVTAAALSSLPGGGAFRTGLVASANDVWAHHDGERSPSLAISPETVPSAQHPGHRRGTDTHTQDPSSHVPHSHHSGNHHDHHHHQRDDPVQNEHHRHRDPRLSHLPHLELYAPMIDAMQQRIQEEVSRAVAAERVSGLMPPGSVTSQSYATDMADYQRLRESMAGELYGLKRQIQHLLRAPIGVIGSNGGGAPAGLPTYPSMYEFPGRGGGGGKGLDPPLVRRSSSLHGDHLSPSHSLQRKSSGVRSGSVKPLRESKLGLSGSIDVSLRRSSNYNMMRSGSQSNHNTPVRRDKKKIVVKVIKGYDSPPVPYTKRREPPPSPKRTSPERTPTRAGGGFSKKPVADESPSSPIRGKLRRSSASDLRHSLSDFAATPGPRGRSYSQSTFMEESVDDISD